MIAALTRRRSPSDLSIAKEQRFYAGIFLLPTVLIALGLVAYPLIYSLLLTVRGAGDLPGELGPWIGLSNWTQHHGAASVAAYEQAVAMLDGRPPSRRLGGRFRRSMQARALLRRRPSPSEHTGEHQSDGIFQHGISKLVTW